MPDTQGVPKIECSDSLKIIESVRTLYSPSRASSRRLCGEWDGDGLDEGAPTTLLARDQQFHNQ